MVESVPCIDDGLRYHHRPLHQLRQALRGESSAATLGQQARQFPSGGLYQVIDTGAPLTIAHAVVLTRVPVGGLCNGHLFRACLRPLPLVGPLCDARGNSAMVPT